MATYPNNYRTAVGFLQNYTFLGVPAYYFYNSECGTGAGSRLNIHVSDGGVIKRTQSAPDGYGMRTPFPPIRAGAMSAWNNTIADLQISCNLLAGGQMAANEPIATVSGTGDAALIVKMSANSVMATLTGDGMSLKMTIKFDGTGVMQITGGPSNLGMIVPFDGSGIVAALNSGTTDLRGKLALQGEWTPFTELSPQGLATAVWGAVATDNNIAGTMGGKLNAAASGGVDLNALAEAVWEYIDRTLTSSGGSGYTPEQIAAAILAAAQITPIAADLRKVKGQTVGGSGSENDPWGPQ